MIIKRPLRDQSSSRITSNLRSSKTVLLVFFLITQFVFKNDEFCLWDTHPRCQSRSPHCKIIVVPREESSFSIEKSLKNLRFRLYRLHFCSQKLTSQYHRRTAPARCTQGCRCDQTAWRRKTQSKINSNQWGGAYQKTVYFVHAVFCVFRTCVEVTVFVTACEMPKSATTSWLCSSIRRFAGSRTPNIF